jgi:hypothetical protein
MQRLASARWGGMLVLIGLVVLFAPGGVTPERGVASKAIPTPVPCETQRAQAAAAPAACPTPVPYEPEAPDSVVPDPEDTYAGPAPPVLTAAQEAEARQLIAASAQSLLAGRAYTITEIGPWTTEDQQLIGVTALLTLESPASLSTRHWPVVSAATQAAASRSAASSESSSSSYQQSTSEFSASNVTEVMSSVDLTTDRVVEMEPGGPDAVITAGSSVKPFPAPPEDQGA